ncbi:hypothetical protein HK100_004304 [Physocladia obscura]|uniref:Uncharacterized protein n=1 Tax=Physocladia obscura TaxID=109957 RepID=A0AAD5ST49_9FUNG|nr:hypothetical protein HK100_004304 [Physocladia obscura]
MNSSFTTYNALKVSEFVRDLAWKLDGTQGFEILAQCLENLQDKLLKNLPPDTRSFIVKQLNDVKMQDLKAASVEVNAVLSKDVSEEDKPLGDCVAV